MSLARKVITGTGIVTAAGVVSRALSLLTAPLLSRLLGPEPYGVAALAGNTVALASTLALVGIDQAYARFYLQERGESRASVERYSWRFAALGATVAALASSAIWYWLGERWVRPDQMSVVLYLAPAILLSIMGIMATTRVRLAGNYRLLAAAMVCGALAAAMVSIGAALLGQRDAWCLLGGTIAGSVTTLALLGMPDMRALARSSALDRAQKRALVLLGVSGSITAPMHWVISSSDRWFLAHFADSAAVGVYSMIANVAMVGLMLNSSLTLTWFPEASRIYSENSVDALAPLGRLWERLVVALALVWVGVSAASGDIVRLLTAPAFHVGVPYAPWLAGGVFFYGLAAMATTAFFLARRMRYVAWTWLVGAVVSLLMNRLLVPRFGPYGAAVAQCASFAFIALGLLWLSRRVLPLPIQAGRLTLCLAIALVMGVALSLAWSISPLWSLILKAPAYVATSALALRVVAPDWYRTGLTRVRFIGTRLCDR
jgi:O-antigen/teichoic acid export membrane protein